MVNFERAALACARSGDGMALMLQPVIDLETGETVSHEVLFRLECNSGVLRGPQEVFDLAAKLGVTAQLDEQVLLGAAKLSARHGPLSVNLCAVAPALHILRGVRGLPLTIEILETDPSLRTGALHEHLGVLNGLGLHAILDDFGEGDVRHDHILDDLAGVKLDRRLTLALARGGVAADSIKAMVGPLKARGMYVVAEGIETPEILAAVKGIATHGQGYHIQRPFRPEP